MALSLSTLAALAAAGLALATCHHGPPKAVQQAQAIAATATAQSGLDRSTAAASDRYSRRTALSQAATDQSEDEVRHVPSASDPLAPDLLSAWRAGVDRVRQQSDAGPAGGDDPRKPDKAVPTS